MTATHPTDRDLADFLLGKLPEPELASVEGHLSECDPCRDRAVTVRADDTFTELLAAARTRFDSRRMSAPTPTLDGLATPPAFAPTQAWDGTTRADGTVDVPPALAAHPKYRPVRRLGTGGMGTVWLAEHLVMHRPVAIKVIRPDLLARPGATGRFLREVRAAAKLHHPNIVTAFDAEPAGDSCLLVMEYVPGKTLGEQLDAGPLSVAEACKAVRDAARGLAHAHAHGLVHRDVKPHNLIRSADGTTKVLDFGLAGVGAGEAIPTSGDGLTGAGMVVGTPDYIAPEQITDPHAADARADIYGLGCTLYHLLAGRPPMPDGSVAEKLTAQPTFEPDPIPGMAADLSAVLAKMLAKRAEDRYQTADEVVDALEGIIDQVRPVARNPWTCSGKPQSWVTALFIGALVIAAGVVIKIQRDNQEITIATDDPDIEVVMKRKGEVLRIIDKKTNQQWDIDTAKNEIARADTAEGLALAIPEKEGIILKRNGKTVFTVSRTPRPAVDTDTARAAWLQAAVNAANGWLGLMDAAEFVRAWEGSAAIVRKSIPQDQFIQLYEELAQKNGYPRNRTLTHREFVPTASGVPTYMHVRLTYRTTFQRSGERTETVESVLEADGHWRVETYRIDPMRTPAVGGDAPPVPRLVQTISEGHRFPYQIAFTPDGKMLLTTGRDYFAAYDPATGKELFSDRFGHASWSPLAVSADGRTAAVASGDLFLYDLAARKRVVTIDTEIKKSVRVSALTLSPDGQKLAYVAGDGSFEAGRDEVVYYDRPTGQTERTRPDDDTDRVFALRYSPDGRYLALASRVEADRFTRISLLDTKTRKLVGRHGTTSRSRATLQFSRDGRQLFVTGLVQRTFLVLGVPDAKVIEREPDLPPSPGAPVPSPDGTRLALVEPDGDVRVWDRALKRVVFDWDPHPNARPEFVSGAPKDRPMRTSVAFAPDGRTLATARGDQIRVWDMTADPPAAKSAEPDIEKLVDPAKGDGKGLPFALLEQNGVAALRFGKWRLVFEGVACDSGGKVLFGVGSFFFPESGGRGNIVDPGLKPPAPTLGQQWNGRTNEIILKNYRFEMEAKGARLVFADKTYVATDQVWTIVIARDGTTRLEPAAKK